MLFILSSLLAVLVRKSSGGSSSSTLCRLVSVSSWAIFCQIDAIQVVVPTCKSSSPLPSGSRSLRILIFELSTSSVLVRSCFKTLVDTKRGLGWCGGRRLLSKIILCAWACCYTKVSVQWINFLPYLSTGNRKDLPGCPSL